MAKRQTTDTMLARLRELRAAPDNPAAPAALHEILSARLTHGIVLKLAATLARDGGHRALAPDLAGAIQHFLGPDAAKTDPGCEGKTEAARTLIEWDAETAEPFLRLAAYRQMEASYVAKGGYKDTAAELRGLAAIAVARLRPSNALILLADLLADPEPLARANAAIAWGIWPGAEAGPVLRLKAHLGDDSPDVHGEVLAALLRHDFHAHLELVTAALDHEAEAVVQAAALALGGSHHADALAPLIAAHTKLRGSPIATTLLMAIAMLRSEPAIDFLLSLLATSSERESLNILDALAPYKADPRVRARLTTLADGRPEVRGALRELFDA